jgi:cytochrome c-type biogenesis protein CcmH/NrfF
MLSIIHESQERRLYLSSWRTGSPRAGIVKALQLIMIAAVVTLSTGAGDPSARYNRLSHQLMCTCGCAQLLGECNHVGCPDSPGMLDHLRTDLAQEGDDKAVLIDFQNRYGATALAAPRFTAFNHLAWIAPPFLLFLGIGAVAFFVRRWRLQTASIPAHPQQFSAREFDSMRDRIRHDTEF